MANIKSRLLAGVLAVVTAATPTASYASVIDIDNDVVSISTATDKETSSKFLFITLKTKGGSVILNKDTVDQQVIKLDYHNVKVDESGKTEKKLFIEVYDKDEILLFSEEAEKNKNTYMYEVEADKVVTVDAVADKGYGITGFEGTEGEVEDKLGEELRPSFTYPVFMDEDAKVSVKFGEIPKEEAPPVEEEADKTTGEEDLTVEQPEAAEDESDVEEDGDDESETDDDLTVSEGDEAEVEDDLTVSEDEEAEDEADLTVNEGEADEVEDNETDEDLTMGSSEDSDNLLEEPEEQPDAEEDDLLLTENNEQPDEHFTDFTEEIYTLDSEQFETARLVILTDSPDDIIDKEHLIASYDNIYLMQYKTVEQAMNAYLYYESAVRAVEPDMKLETASETADDVSAEDAPAEPVEVLGTEPTEVEGLTVTEDYNPVAMLAEEIVSPTVQNADKVIALIDTGASSGPNVIDRVSMIDDVMEGNNNHANMMVKAITEQNPGAKILSVRALGDDGYGSISSVVSAIEYAINADVDIINLSMYSKRNLTTSVLEAEVQKAIESGITVVGAAGNDNADVADYVPGSIPDVWTIGAVNEKGAKQMASNYGAFVDYYVVGEYTSDAAARFTGYISLNGIDAAESDESGLIFKDYDEDSYGSGDIFVDNENPDVSKDENMIYDPVIENHVRDNADKSYVGDGKLELVNFMDIKATIATEEQLRPGETFETLMADSDEFRFLTQQVGRVPVYQMEEDPRYLVAYADVMHSETRARIIDSAVAQNNTNGIAIDGCYLDTESGLLYIPADAYRDENGTFLFGYLQTQILYAISGYDIMSQWNAAALSVTEEPDGDIIPNMTGDNILLQQMTVQVGKYMDVESMLVTVNGFPIGGSLYSYDSQTGLLTVGFSSAAVQSIWVQAEKSDDAPEVEPGMKAAWGANTSGGAGVTFAAMVPVASTKVKAKLDKLFVGYETRSNVRIIYPEAPGNMSGAACAGTVVYAYRGFQYGSDELDQELLNYIFNKSGNVNTILGGKGYDIGSGCIYPFAIKLKDIDDQNMNFEVFDENLHLVLECSHVHMDGFKDGIGTGDWEKGHIIMRCVAADTTSKNPYAVFAIYTNKLTTQHGLGLFKVSLEAEDGSVKLTKRIGNAEMVSMADSVYISTHLSVYTDKACKKLCTSGTVDGKNFTGTLTLKAEPGESRASKTIVGLPPGPYYVKEVDKNGAWDRCPGTTNNTHIYKFVVVEGKTTTELIDLTTNETSVTFPNTPFAGGFKIMKKDEEGTLLPGAVFQIKWYGHSRTDASEKAEAVWYFKSGDGKNGTEKGVVKYDEKYYLKTFTSPSGKTYKSDPPITRTDGKWLLPLSYMYVKEVQAPEGYVKDNSEKTLRIKNASSQQDADGLYTKVTCPDAEATFINHPDEDRWKVRVQAKKVNETLKPLEGAIFYVYDNEACDGEPVAILTSGPDGMTNIQKIEDIPGTQEEITLYCKEYKAPAGCALVDTKFPLTFKKSVFAKLSEAEKKEGELQVFGPPEGIVNKEFDGWKISVNLKKVKEDGSPLEGAEFGVFPDSVCAKEPYGTLISTADGTTNTLTIDVPNDQDEITVYCMETKAPKGYSLNKQVYQLTFRKEDYEKLTEEQKKTGEIKSFKGSDGNDIVNKEFDGWKVRVYAKKVNQSYEGLAGAVFEVYGDEACVNDLKGTLTSGADGMTEDLIVEVPAGQTEITLYCKEVTAPEGCTPTDERFKVMFKQSDWNALPQSDKDAGGERKPFGPDKGIINQVTGTPTPTPPTPEGGQGGLYIKKTSTVDPEILKLNGYSLAGAVFEVTSDRDDSGTLTTKENGISESMPLKDYSWKEPHEAVLGPNDEVITEAWVETHHVTTNYIVTETKPPKGHQVSHQKSDPIPVKTPDDNGKTFEVKFEDEPIFCKNKLDIEKLSSKGNPIEGVVFKVELFDSPSGESGNPVKTWYLESDKNGKIYLDEAHITHRLGYQSDPFFMHKGKIVIPIDCYLKFTEVAAPAEYIINDKPFGLPTGEDAELSYRAYNEPQPCEVKIKKYEADGSTPITGVEFEIKFLEEAVHANGNKHPNFKRLLEVGQTYVAHTDENGELVFKNLDQGKYEITEIKTETGHGLLKDPIIVTLPMTMTEEEASAYGNIDWGKGKEDVSYTNKWFFYSCLYEITNNANLKMPMSGGLGDWKYGFIGMGVIAMIGTSLIVHESLNKKRRKTHKRKKQNIDDFKI